MTANAPQPCTVYDLKAEDACHQWAWFRDKRSGQWLCGDHCPSISAVGRPRLVVVA